MLTTRQTLPEVAQQSIAAQYQHGRLSRLHHYPIGSVPNLVLTLRFVYLGSCACRRLTTQSGAREMAALGHVDCNGSAMAGLAATLGQADRDLIMKLMPTGSAERFEVVGVNCSGNVPGKRHTISRRNGDGNLWEIFAASDKISVTCSLAWGRRPPRVMRIVPARICKSVLACGGGTKPNQTAANASATKEAIGTSHIAMP